MSDSGELTEDDLALAGAIAAAAGELGLRVDLTGPPRKRSESADRSAIAAGGRIVYDGHAPGWWTLADPEGNEGGRRAVAGHGLSPKRSRATPRGQAPLGLAAGSLRTAVLLDKRYLRPLAQSGESV
jgi:hypothetical protein